MMVNKLIFNNKRITLLLPPMKKIMIFKLINKNNIKYIIELLMMKKLLLMNHNQTLQKNNHHFQIILINTQNKPLKDVDNSYTKKTMKKIENILNLDHMNSKMELYILDSGNME
jgi:hypothetical protein